MRFSFHRLSSRRGVTLIELLLFVAIFAIVAFATLPLIFSATENRLMQQSVALVEQNGLQALQQIARLTQSERVLDPLPQHSGVVLAFQSGSGATNPTIIGMLSGSLVVIRHATRQVITSPQVAVDSLQVWNTSTSATRQSFRISFRVSRAIRLQASRTYERTFEGAFTLPPADAPKGAVCGGVACEAPACAGTIYAWQVCEHGVCADAQTSLPCSGSGASSSSS